jgi:hypothetical protein
MRNRSSQKEDPRQSFVSMEVTDHTLLYERYEKTYLAPRSICFVQALLIQHHYNVKPYLQPMMDFCFSPQIKMTGV